MSKLELQAHVAEMREYLLDLRTFMARLRFEKADRIRARHKAAPKK